MKIFVNPYHFKGKDCYIPITLFYKSAIIVMLQRADTNIIENKVCFHDTITRSFTVHRLPFYN